MRLKFALLALVLPLVAVAGVDITRHGYITVVDANGAEVGRVTETKELIEVLSELPNGTYSVTQPDMTAVVDWPVCPTCPEDPAPDPGPDPEPPAPEPEPPAPPSGDAPFDLSGYDIPFQCGWPQAPRTTSVATAASPADLQAAVDQGNIEVRVTWSGTRQGDLHIRRDDVRVLMPNDATLEGQLRISSRQAPIARVAWIGGNHRLGPIIVDQTDDLLFYDFHSVHDAQGRFDNVNDFRGSPGGLNRSAFVSSTFAGINPGSRDSYTFYSEANPNPSRCMIMADTLFEQDPGGSHVTRLQGMQGLIIVQSAFIQPDQGDTAFRFHRNVTDAFVADTIIQGRVKLDTIDAGDAVSVTRGIFDNVDIYNSHNCSPATENGVTNSGEWRNSTLHTLQNCGGSFSTQSLRDGGGNSVVGWNGSPPDVRGVGAQR